MTVQPFVTKCSINNTKMHCIRRIVAKNVMYSEETHHFLLNLFLFLV